MSESIQAPQDNRLLVDARKIIDTARANAVRSVDFNRVMMYWNLGKRIFEEEQQGRDRAEYGAKMLQNLAEALVVEYGSGFSYRQLAFSRQFYRVYPIVNTLYSQLNWSQYKLLISIDEADKREYYQLEAVSNCWTKRELERQIHSQLWERLCLSNDKASDAVVKMTLPEDNQTILAAEYKLHLPTEELLLEVRKATEEYEEAARRRRDSE